MSEQHCANHPHLMLQLPGTWQSVGTGASLPVHRKLTQALPSHLADLLFDPLAIVRVPCCVYVLSVALRVNIHQGKSELRFPWTGKRE